MIESVYGKKIADWITRYPLIEPLINGEAVSWFNPAITPLAQALGDIPLTAADVEDAHARLTRFASYLSLAFPELEKYQGFIESELVSVDKFARRAKQFYDVKQNISLLVKKDSHLPVAGSVKARGGIYEVLCYAEKLALQHGLLKATDDYRILNQPPAQELFKSYKVAVGSTGNLGMSIGISAARLGFETIVHMSSDARQWKKDTLRAHGVTVIEYAGDYGQAVEQGRKEAEKDPRCYFIDDENSTTLFLGYAVAGERLKIQLEQQNISVDADHPLFVYLPCGVGGGPGGIAFGLKLAFGDHVHCIFAEPTQSPCMLMGVYTGLHDKLAVQDFGISNATAADGLAVGRPSGFVGTAMQHMIDGYYTLPDEELFSLLYLMYETEQLKLEPSALAGAAGFARILTETQGYRQRMGFSNAVMDNANHLIWATGGGMVPDAEFAAYLATGQRLIRQD